MIQLLLGAGFDAASLPLDIAELQWGASVARLDGRRLSHSRVDGVDTYQTVTVDQRVKGFALNLGASFKATDIVTVGLSAENVFSTVTWTGTRTEADLSTADNSLSTTPNETRFAKREVEPSRCLPGRHRDQPAADWDDARRGRRKRRHAALRHRKEPPVQRRSA